MRSLYKQSGRVLGALLVMVLCIGLFPMKAAAAEGSITLHYLLSDCTFSLYHVADYAADGCFELTDDFSEVAVDWSDLTEDDNWYALAQTLSSVVVSDAIDPAVTGATDQDGSVSFAGLASGLYLMTAEVKSDEDGTYYTVTPLLIAVPGTNTDGEVEYDRDITISKYSMQATTTIAVQKIWEGEETNRPASITVGLYADGALTDTQEISESNNWRCSWTDLDADVTWTVAETAVPDGYTVSYSTADDGTYVITNTVVEEGSEESERSEDSGDSENPGGSENSEDTDEDLPQTGLDWGPAAALVLIGLVCLLIGVAKNRLGASSEK